MKTLFIISLIIVLVIDFGYCLFINRCRTSRIILSPRSTKSTQPLSSSSSSSSTSSTSSPLSSSASIPKPEVPLRKSLFKRKRTTNIIKSSIEDNNEEEDEDEEDDDDDENDDEIRNILLPGDFSSNIDDFKNMGDLGIQHENFKSGFVAIVGNPNVGKSTLMNAFLNQSLSIVSPKPQTTRHRILGIVTEDDYQLIFSDTPGMVEPKYELHEAMMDSVRGAAGDADVIMLVTDVYGEPLVDKHMMMKLTETKKQIIVAINKVDILESDSVVHNYMSRIKSKNIKDSNKKSMKYVESNDNKNNSSNDIINDINTIYGLDVRSELDLDDDENKKPLPIANLTELWKQRLPHAMVIPISASQKTGVDSLLNNLLDNIPKGPKYYQSDTVTTRDERFFAAEIIRETLFFCYKDEVPYSCEVVIEAFKDRSPTLSYIEAIIVISRDSQKGILLGKGGERIKDMATKARQKLESFLDRKVYLEVKVKVMEDWRSSKEALMKFGYIDTDDN